MELFKFIFGIAGHPRGCEAQDQEDEHSQERDHVLNSLSDSTDQVAGLAQDAEIGNESRPHHQERQHKEPRLGILILGGKVHSEKGEDDHS